MVPGGGARTYQQETERTRKDKGISIYDGIIIASKKSRRPGQTSVGVESDLRCGLISGHGRSLRGHSSRTKRGAKDMMKERKKDRVEAGWRSWWLCFPFLFPQPGGTPRPRDCCEADTLPMRGKGDEIRFFGLTMGWGWWEAP